MRKEDKENEMKHAADDQNNSEETGHESETANSAEAYEEKIKDLESMLDDYKDRILRKAAEFENYKRRTEIDQSNLLKYAAENFIIKLLPVVDDFERSIRHIDNSKDIEAVRQGIHLVYDKFKKLLDEQGVKKIDAIGKPFNVEFHEALMQRTEEKTPPHTVLDELESGYMYKDRVIRHSKVIVSDDQSGTNSNPEE